VIGVRSLELGSRAWEEVVHELRFRHFVWKAYGAGRCLLLPEAIVLPRATHDTLVAAAEGLHAALGRLEAAAREDPEALARLGVPAPLRGILVGGEPLGLAFARYDFHPTEDGRWMVPEFNEDAPGGFNEAVGLPAVLGSPGKGLGWVGDLRPRLVEAFAPWDAVALLYATAYAEDLQHVLVLERWLREAGHATVLASPEHLAVGWRGGRAAGLRVEAAFRFYPGEWIPRLANLEAWRRLAPRLPTMNPLARLVRQSKAIFAFAREAGRLGAGDRALFERHGPLTSPFDPAERPRLRAERPRWVLKRLFGRMGDSVLLGAAAGEAAWDAALEEASRAPAEWCVQERFAVRPLAFRAGALHPAVGVYLVNGRFAGYYSRASAGPVVDHGAFHVATLVEDA
jgi:glutathionylspermidine synthase